MVNINGEVLNATEFAWDGCHKIYIMETQEDRELFSEYGYDFYPIEGLKEAYDSSCGLKFISHGNLDLKDFVPQGTPKSKVRITKR